MSGMTLPVKHDLAAMEATSVAEIPSGEGWQYEPKWDGFRCLAFRDGGTIDLRSKAGQPLARYFPDIVGRLRELDAEQFVLDGELVIPSADGKGLSFDALLQRIHPAESRVRKLAAETPAWLVVFDLLVTAEGVSLLGEPLRERPGAVTGKVGANGGVPSSACVLTASASALRPFSKVGEMPESGPTRFSTACAFSRRPSKSPIPSPTLS